MPVKYFIKLEIISYIPFLKFQCAKKITKPTGINILWKMQFSIISGHTVYVLNQWMDFTLYGTDILLEQA